MLRCSAGALREERSPKIELPVAERPGRKREGVQSVAAELFSGCHRKSLKPPSQGFLQQGMSWFDPSHVHHLPALWLLVFGLQQVTEASPSNPGPICEEIKATWPNNKMGGDTGSGRAGTSDLCC